MFRPARRLLLGLVLAALAGPVPARTAAPLVTVTPAGDMMLGDPKARIEVVEYASLTCPHCAAFNRDVFPALKARYIDTGKVRYVFKEQLTAPAELAAAGYLVARCAGREKYFSAVDAFFRAQEEMYGAPRAVLLRIAQAHGLSEDQFTACIRDQAAAEAIYKRSDRGWNEDKIEGTPRLVVNGTRLPAGEVTLAELEAAIAQARKTRR